MLRIFLPFLCLFVFSLPVLSKASEELPRINNGVWDLSKIDFKSSEIIPLKGNTYFLHKEFLDASKMSVSDLDTLAKERASILPIGKSWFGAKLKDGSEINERFTYGTHFFKVKVDERFKNESFAFESSGFNSAASFLVNGRSDFIKRIANVSDSLEAETHFKMFQVVSLPAMDNSEFYILIHVSNHRFNNPGTFDFPSFFGQAETIRSHYHFKLLKAFGVAGILFILAIYHFILFLLRREDKASLGFAIVALGLLLRLVGFEKFLNFMIPEPLHHFGAWFCHYLSYGSVAWAPWTLIFFMHHLGEELIPKKVFKIAGYVCLIPLIPLLFTPYTFNQQYWLPALQLNLLVWIVYIIYRLGAGMFLKNKELRSVVRLIIIFAVLGFLAVLNDLLMARKIINTFYMAQIGFLVFFMGQSFVLARMFSKAYREAEYLSENLQHEVDKQTVEIEEQKAVIEETLGNIKADLGVAADVAKVMLPIKKVDGNGFHLNMFFQPADELAGDLYGQEYQNGRLLFWVCDVTGHGIASSMVASVIRESMAICRNEKIFSGEPDPAGALEVISERVNGAVHGRYFATMVVAVYEEDTKRITFSNSAHLSPLLMTADSDKCKSMKMKRGPLLGAQSVGYDFYNAQFTLSEGDQIFIYTDGLNEGLNIEKDRQYGNRRVKQFIDLNKNHEDLPTAIYADMISFQQREDIDDDVSMAILQIK